MQRRPSLTEGKLMIMRVLKSMEPLDENQLAEFFAEPDLLTFFEIKVALDELQGSELIAGRKRGNSQPDAYMLTAKGRTTYDMFMYDLPLPLRDKVDALLPEWRRRFRRREQVRTKYYRAGEDDYCAQLSIFEHGTPRDGADAASAGFRPGTAGGSGIRAQRRTHLQRHLAVVIG